MKAAGWPAACAVHLANREKGERGYGYMEFLQQVVVASQKGALQAVRHRHSDMLRHAREEELLVASGRSSPELSSSHGSTLVRQGTNSAS